jgi:glutamate synthase domain-containing protein 2
MLSLASKKTAITGRHIVKELAGRHYHYIKGHHDDFSTWLLTRNHDDVDGPQKTRSNSCPVSKPSTTRSIHTSRRLLTPETTIKDSKDKPIAPVDMVSHNFPDFIEHWNRDMFRTVGYGLSAATVLAVAMSAATITTTTASTIVPSMALGLLTFGYWKIGLNDIQQKSHTLSRNYPVLGHVRYLFETIRPELRQYIVESDTDGKPFDRNHRSQVYRRAKGNGRFIPCMSKQTLFIQQQQHHVPTPGHVRVTHVTCFSFAYLPPPPPPTTTTTLIVLTDDTVPFGTRRNVYEVHHEWACHSMWPVQISTAANNDATAAKATRTMVGTAAFGTTQPYSASVFNVSGMSYGAISDNAILALNGGAKRAHCFQNTGEGGVSRFHLQEGGDLVWNIGTGCFGCGSGTGEKRVFEPSMFQETLEKASGQIKMVEIKLSQGAKPGKGGILPRAKITREIAEARRLAFPPTDDCHSPHRHASFNNAYELVEFIARVRELSGGLPVGIKMCVGEPREIGVLCKAMIDIGNGPDFITVDGAEGGTGAAPAELSDSVGQPLEEGLVLVRNFLIGCGLKDKVKLNASGRITSGFSIVRTLALGADYTSAARAFMMSIGCIQALKCNTNKCPTGIATLDKDLMYGLDPTLKSTRGKLFLPLIFLPLYVFHMLILLVRVSYSPLIILRLLYSLLA